MAPHIMNEEEWVVLREMRLAALQESPTAFLSSYSEESAYKEREWRAEFERGEWTIEVSNDKKMRSRRNHQGTRYSA
jgi:hypothetical protein